MTIMSEASRGVTFSLRSVRLRAAVLGCLLALGVLLVGGVSSAQAAKQIVDILDHAGPAGIAVNQGTGDMYVVDASSDQVQHLDASGSELSSFGSSCADPGGACAEGEFSFGGELAGAAVAPDGSVYVADILNNRIQKFTADGTFVLTFGLDVDPAGDASFEVCTSGCKAGVAGSGDGELSSPIGVAVDPTTSDVLVADRGNLRVQRFNSGGDFVSEVASGLADPHRVAVDSTGAIYVLEQRSQVLKFETDDAPGEVFAPSVINLQGNGPTELTIGRGDIPANDHVFVVQQHVNPVSENFEGGEVLEFDTAGGLLETHLEPAPEAAGLAVHVASGRVYVAENSPDAQRILVLDEPPQTATIRDTTNVEATTATLNGTVNPGGTPVGYHYEISADNGQTWTPFPATDEPLGNGTDDIDVTQSATGLQPGAAYRVRLVVTSEFGSVITSAEDTFTTPIAAPTVTTLQANQLRATGAQLQGTVNPNTLPTTYHFEYGTTTAYGTTTSETSAGSGGTPITVTHQLNGLAPSTTYHYRLVATNSVGTSTGNDRAFTTRTAGPTDLAPDGPRAYELVSPAHKVGGTGVGHWYGGPDAAGRAGYAAWDAERFAVHGQNGSVLIDGKMTFIDDWSFAERTRTGWVNKPGLSKRTFGVETLATAIPSAAAEDLSLTAWGGAHAIRIFPEMEDWPDQDYPVMRRWTEDGWQIFGPLDAQNAVGTGATLGVGPKATAADGSAFAISSPATRGLAGPDDPSLDLPNVGDLDVRFDDPSSVYLDEITGPFSDAFPGDDRKRELVNVCTEGTVIPTPSGSEPCPDAPANRYARLISRGGASLTVGEDAGNPPASVISADGSRLFFMSPDPKLAGSLDPQLSGIGDAQLYVRQRNADGEVLTRWISQTKVANQPAALRAPALFEGASRDGDKVFFRTTAPLTADDPNGQGAAPPGGVTSGLPSDRSSDLYMYDLPDGPNADPAGGTLTRISAGPTGTADCNSPVQVDPAFAGLRFVSHDASRVYFACAAPLAGAVDTDSGNITDSDGTPTTDDAANLYLYDTREPAARRWQFIARLPSGGGLASCATISSGRGSTLEAAAGGTGDAVSVRSASSCVRGTSDGSLTTFFTAGRLIADDPDADSLDIYGYDADRDELTRLSAPQGGPDGTYPCLIGEGPGPQCHADPGIGPGQMALEMLNVATRPGGENLAFFHSARRLVPQDTDDAYDVYQWRAGELSLISTGRSDTDGAFYLGNDRAGINVYFATRDQLTWQDKDRVLDVYTARIGGGIPEPPPSPKCVVHADGCQAAGPNGPQPKIGSGTPGTGNKLSRPKTTLALRKLTAAQRRNAAKRGVLRIRVRTNRAGLVKVSAKAKIGTRQRTVAKGQKRFRKAGTATVRLRLNAAARRRLATGKALKLRITARAPGARSKAMSATLKRSGGG